MIVISAGMVKSGSLWLWNMTNDLLSAAGLKKEGLPPVHSPVENFIKEDYEKVVIGALSFNHLTRATLSHFKGHSYPAKTHSAPTLPLILFRPWGHIKATYVYRDPRDVVLSVLDHAQKAREEDIAMNLRDIHTFEESVDFVRVQLMIWNKWSYMPGTFKIKYEDLVANTEKALKNLADYLSLQVSEDQIKMIRDRYSRNEMEREKEITNKTHFNKGKTKRFLDKMDPEQIAYCERAFQPYLEHMGYVNVDSERKVTLH